MSQHQARWAPKAMRSAAASTPARNIGMPGTPGCRRCFPTDAKPGPAATTPLAAQFVARFRVDSDLKKWSLLDTADE
ncbi:MAG TPA: hypothetical protein VGR97_10635 [Candidatus Acidoferrales bacterium]|nr:hypothetical protein [Candidatus Acidoferrales bacterium]